MKHEPQKLLPTILKISPYLFCLLAAIIFVESKIINSQKREDAKENAKIINNILSENFEQTEKILTLIGKKIAKETPELNLDKIHKIFNDAAISQSSNNLFSWSFFDWVNANSFQTVNTLLGVNKKSPRDMSDRLYSSRGAEPWILIFSKPVLGSPSKILVIPVGVQVATENLPRLGTVVVGISINKLTNLIEARIGKYNRFIIIDKRNDHAVFGSNKITDFNINTNKFPVLNEGNVYTNILEMGGDYPYKILTGYDYTDFWIEAISISLRSFIKIVAIAFIVVLLTTLIKRNDLNN
jgi:hypothetical protein